MHIVKSFVYICVCMHSCINMNVCSDSVGYMHVFVWAYVCICVYVSVIVYACLFACMCGLVYLYVVVCVFVCVYMCECGCGCGCVGSILYSNRKQHDMISTHLHVHK